MKLAETIQDRREGILQLAKKHGAGNLALFGSAARGEDGPNSDVDLLIDVTGETSSWFPCGLASDLEELLGRRVQIVIRRSLNPLIRKWVLKDARPL